jgi:hypothetical protein
MTAIAAAYSILAATVLEAQVTGVVFADRNANGVRDAREPGIAGIAVSNQNDVVLTDAAGRYTLPRGAGHGLLFVSIPNGYRSVGAFWVAERDTASFGLAPGVHAESFTFVHASDTHISEQSLPRTRRLRALVEAERPAFVLITGDLVRDALRVGETEARGYYDLFMRERAAFRMPVYTTPGNHEIFGIERQLSKVDSTHPLFGKTMYRAYLGPDYYSFNYGGVHFVALNTVDVHDGWYYGHVDSLQLAWLERDLARLPPITPVVTFNHIPFYSTSELINGFEDQPPAPTLITVNGKTSFRHTVSNAGAVLSALAKQRHVMAIGGHVHMAERINYEGQGTRFVNGAAIVAPTKAGPQVYPSGFTVYTVKNRIIDGGRFVLLGEP